MTKRPLYSPEVRERAVRLVLTSEAQRMQALERENRELKRTNEILKRAAAFFAQAGLDRKRK